MAEASDTTHTSRVSGSRSGQNPSPTDNQVDPGTSMEQMATPMKKGAPAYDGGAKTTEPA